jgi:hypothetical protein
MEWWSSSGFERGEFSQGVAGELDAVSIVNDAIKDGVGEGWIPKHLRMPHLLMGLCLM